VLSARPVVASAPSSPAGAALRELAVSLVARPGDGRVGH